MTKLPASLQQRSDVDSIREDVVPYRGMTVEQHSQALSELCRWARDAIESSPNPVAAWRWEDKRSARSMALWLGLVSRAKNV